MARAAICMRRLDGSMLTHAACDVPLRRYILVVKGTENILLTLTQEQEPDGAFLYRELPAEFFESLRLHDYRFTEETLQ